MFQHRPNSSICEKNHEYNFSFHLETLCGWIIHSVLLKTSGVFLFVILSKQRTKFHAVLVCRIRRLTKRRWLTSLREKLGCCFSENVVTTSFFFLLLTLAARGDENTNSIWNISISRANLLSHRRHWWCSIIHTKNVFFYDRNHIFHLIISCFS